jgi:hypothetical protein
VRAELSLAKVAQAAPGWDHGVRPASCRLEETYYYEPPTVTWSHAVCRGAEADTSWGA